MIIYTNKHKVPFQIDDDDALAVSYYSWHIDPWGYPRTVLSRIYTGKNQKGLNLHNFLLGMAPGGLEWDHRNRDPLDNRRNNIRLVTHTINMRNRNPRIDHASSIDGVIWFEDRQKWRAMIRINNGLLHLGSYADFEKAKQARIEAEIQYWGSER